MNDLLQSVQVALSAGNQVERIREIKRVSNYIIKNGMHQNWTEEELGLLIGYHMAKGTLIVSYGKSGVAGVMTWNHCNENEIKNVIENYRGDNEDGDSIIIDMLLTSESNAIKKICANFLFKCPQALNKKVFAFRERSSGPKLVQYTNKLFKKILEKGGNGKK